MNKIAVLLPLCENVKDGEMKPNIVALQLKNTAIYK
jgi:hypothetical protein